MRFHVPIRLPSLANTRMCWQKLASIKSKQRKAVAKYMRVTRTDRSRLPPMPLVVTITRAGPKKLDDDNLQSACKYVRDEIARIVGVDDGSSLYTWQYSQRVGEYGVDVEIVTRGDGL